MFSQSRKPSPGRGGKHRARIRANSHCQGRRTENEPAFHFGATLRGVERHFVKSNPSTERHFHFELRVCGSLTKRSEDYLFPSRIHESPHPGTRQYARIVDCWVQHIGLDPSANGTHSMRRTKNLRAVRFLLAHAKLESTLRYLGIEVDDTLARWTLSPGLLPWCLNPGST